MKKSVLLLSIAAYTLSLYCSAYASDIEANISLRNVQVSVTNTKGVQIPTIQLLNNDKNQVLYTNDGSFKDDKYVFEEFSFPLDAASGDYIIRIGEDGIITEKTVYYSSYDETIGILKEIKDDKTKAWSLIEENPKMFGTSQDELKKLTDGWKKRAEKDISNVQISTDTDDEILASYNRIADIIKSAVNYAKLTGTSANDIEEAVKGLSDPDLTYWGKIIDKSVLHEAFSSQNLDELTITDEEMNIAFDGAVLAAVIDICDWGTAKEALKYYVSKGLLSIESKYLESGADVYKALKIKRVMNYRNIPQAIEDAYNTYNKTSNTSGGGGGGGASGGGTSTGKVNSPSAIYSPPVSDTSEQSSSDKNIFTDLNQAEWAKTAINALAERNIVSGRGNGIFAPMDNLTRAEFVKIIVMAFGLTDAEAKADFDDVPEASWSYPYVASAKNAGIISGVSDKYFGAEDKITRQDMAVILMRLAGLINISTDGESVEFTDSGEIADYAAEAVKSLSAAGIVNGMGDGSFSPLESVTRAQGAKVVYEMMCRKGQ